MLPLILIVKALKDKFGNTGTDLLNLVHSGLNSFAYGQGDKVLSTIANLVTPHIGEDNINKLQEQYGIPEDQVGQTIVNAFHKISNESPISSIAGGIGGAIAPMLLTGGTGLLGEGALAGKAATGVKALVGTSSFGARVLGSTLGEAAGGAVLMTPQAMAQATLDKDPKAAGETLAWGALTGGGLGLVMQGAREGVADLKREVGNVQDMINSRKGALNNNSIMRNTENVATVPLTEEERNAAQTEAKKNAIVTVEDQKIPNTKQVVTPTYLSDKLLGDVLNMSPTERAKFGDTVAKQHENLGALIDYLGVDNIKKMNNKRFAQEIINTNEETGPKIGNLIRRMDSVVATDPDQLPSYFTQRDALQQLYDGFKDEPMFASERKVISDAIDHLEKISPDQGYITFDEQQKFKNLLQSKAKYNTADSSMLNTTRKQVAMIARQEMDDAGERVAKEAGEPELIDAWEKQKKMFGLTSALYDSAQKVVNGKEARTLEIGNLVGGLAGHMAGSALGIPGLGTLVGVLGQKLGDQWIRESAPTKIASFLRKNEMNPNFPTYIALDAAKLLEFKDR